MKIDRNASMIAALLVVLGLGTSSCGGGGEESQYADNGGIGGTGISQGEISAFGSIFVNGVEWDLAGATIVVDGAPATEADLRIGMNVLVRGNFAKSGLTGTALSVDFDDSTEGPISDVPTLVMPGGTQKTFTILGQTILVDSIDTVFADGASFGALAMDQVMEVSGFREASGAIRATRIALRGTFPAVLFATQQGPVANLVKNQDGSGMFDLSTTTVRYSATTSFAGLTRAELVEGSVVDVKGDLRPSGTELDASEVELEGSGLGLEDAEDVELKGVVSSYVSLGDFVLGGIPVDASGATLEPPGLTVADGALIEAEGSLVAGRIVADKLKQVEGGLGEVAIAASVSAVDAVAREVTILGVVVFANGETELEDERDQVPNFRFSDIHVGDWITLEGFEVGPARVRAKQIKRKAVDSDVKLRGNVSALDRMLPSLDVLGQPIPIDSGTAYFDSNGQSRTKTQFFSAPGDVFLGDAVVVRDLNALDPQVLSEADEVTLD